jgi:endoglucanase
VASAGSHVSDTQAFKAQIKEKNISDYTMFWSVDGGQQNQMYDSSTDYPHKEAMVDLRDWTWHGGGPYKVTFKALDKDNNVIGEMTVDIFTPNAPESPTTVVSAQSETHDNAPTQNVSVQNVSRVIESVKETVAQSSSVASVSASTVSPSTVSANVNIIWPTGNAVLKGTDYFKAKLDSMVLNDYDMFWQVDDGQLNAMYDTIAGEPHKEASVDFGNWNWHGSGPYKITFTAKDKGGAVITKQDISIMIGNGGSVQKAEQNPVTTKVLAAETVNLSPSPTPTPTPTPSPSPKVALASISSGNPFAGVNFAKNPDSDAQRQVDAWKSSRPADAKLIEKIADNTDQVIWLGGWNSDISNDVRRAVKQANSRGAMPMFVVYNIPLRDCGQYSAGGVNNPEEYRNWIKKIADAIGGDKAMVIVEPDALTLTSCLNGSQLGDRYSMIHDAVSTFRSKGTIAVYIDAGHPNWIAADEMAQRLQKAGVSDANGFSLNVSNFFTTQDNAKYGEDISSKISGKHFVIDTGRNGNGPTGDNQWCNPSGRALGARPTANTGYPLVDAFLWVKGPGASDGNCNGAPNAGVWWPDYAIEIAKNTSW